MSWHICVINNLPPPPQPGSLMMHRWNTSSTAVTTHADLQDVAFKGTEGGAVLATPTDSPASSPRTLSCMFAVCLGTIPLPSRFATPLSLLAPPPPSVPSLPLRPSAKSPLRTPAGLNRPDIIA